MNGNATNMKCKINCIVHTTKSREFEISSDARVWPCCYFVTAWEIRRKLDDLSVQAFNDDIILQQRFSDDPDWNNLAVYSLDTILMDPIFTSYIHTDGWNSDNPPPICKLECSVYHDKLTGELTTKAMLN